jgi:hypothetical protein
LDSNHLRNWERVPVAPTWDHVRGIAIAELPRSVSLSAPHNNLARPISDRWTEQGHAIPMHAPLAGWNGITRTHRVPVRLLTPALPRMR